MAKKSSKVVPPLVIIAWADHASQDAWQSQDEAKKETLQEIRSVGWLIKEDDEVYTLVADHDANYVEVARTMVIGKGLVRAMKTLRKGKNADRKTETGRNPPGHEGADGSGAPTDAKRGNPAAD